ncbi:MAG: hypothetical protein ABIZ70_06110 [Gemmatimonadales bacterium]
MQYFHRTQIAPDAVVAAATAFFGTRLTPAEESPRRLGFKGALGSVTVTVRAEGGHYTLITVATDQPGESELDRLAKRFLGEVHRLADPAHTLRGAY